MFNAQGLTMSCLQNYNINFTIYIHNFTTLVLINNYLCRIMSCFTVCVF